MFGRLLMLGVGFAQLTVGGRFSFELERAGSERRVGVSHVVLVVGKDLQRVSVERVVRLDSTLVSERQFCKFVHLGFARRRVGQVHLAEQVTAEEGDSKSRKPDGAKRPGAGNAGGFHAAEKTN